MTIGFLCVENVCRCIENAKSPSWGSLGFRDGGLVTAIYLLLYQDGVGRNWGGSGAKLLGGWEMIYFLRA